jgi:hypothetical protein
MPELVVRESTMIGFTRVLGAQGNHALWAMVVLYAPWWIEMVPGEVRIATSLNWTAKADFLSKSLFYVTVWIPRGRHRRSSAV